MVERRRPLLRELHRGKEKCGSFRNYVTRIISRTLHNRILSIKDSKDLKRQMPWLSETPISILIYAIRNPQPYLQDQRT